MSIFLTNGTFVQNNHCQLIIIIARPALFAPRSSKPLTVFPTFVVLFITSAICLHSATFPHSRSKLYRSPIYSHRSFSLSLCTVPARTSQSEGPHTVDVVAPIITPLKHIQLSTQTNRPPFVGRIHRVCPDTNLISLYRIKAPSCSQLDRVIFDLRHSKFISCSW